MAFTPAQFREMKDRVKRNKSAPHRLAPVTAVPPSSAADESADIVFMCADKYWTYEFVFQGKPMGKPRMTRQDKFIKRPKVQRYWLFKDAIRAAAGTLPASPDMVLITAWMPMPPSWSQKKRQLLAGQPCRKKPDWDNIGKAVCDALFDEDEGIWVGATIKYWCQPGSEQINVKLLYAKSK